MVFDCHGCHFVDDKKQQRCRSGDESMLGRSLSKIKVKSLQERLTAVNDLDSALEFKQLRSLSCSGLSFE
jgi:hypothetical protein